MKILYITNLPAPYRKEFFSELGLLCDLTVLYERNKASNRDENWKANPNITFLEIYLKGFKIGKENSLCFDVVKYITTKYDLIIIGGYSTFTSMLAILIMRIKGIKFIINADGGFIKNEKFIKRYIKTKFIESANWWLSTGEVTNQYLVHYGANIENIYKYPLASMHENDILKIPLNQNEKNKYKKKLAIDTKILILSVGQLIYRKGYDLLLEASANLPKNVTLCIVGGKPNVNLINLRNKISLQNIKFIDFLNKKEISDYYKAADLFILPTREDVWGLVINEAMAYGLPVVTTNRCISGIEMISENSGRIYEVNNTFELTKILSSFIDGKLLFDSREILEIAHKYSIENMAKTHYIIFNRILECIYKKDCEHVNH